LAYWVCHEGHEEHEDLIICHFSYRTCKMPETGVLVTLFRAIEMFDPGKPDTVWMQINGRGKFSLRFNFLGDNMLIES